MSKSAPLVLPRRPPHMPSGPQGRTAKDREPHAGAQSGPYDEVSLSFLVCSSVGVGIDEPCQAWNSW